VVGELFRRAPGLHVALLSWAVVAWGALLYASVTGASTDYPRFATLVLAPLVIGAAGAFTWLAQSLRSYLGEVAGLGGSPVVIAIGAAALILVMAPFAVVRYQTQMSVYGSRDPDSLSGAVRYLDQALGRDHGAVLTSVRDGKWFEGVTGRDALFSQPVRYAFRPLEWRRSVDAEAILRTSAALTNEFFFVKFTSTSTSSTASAPRGLLIAANHGGEFVDLLQIQASDTKITTSGLAVSVAEAGPKSVTTRVSAQESSIRTTWSHAVGRATVSYSQTVTLLKNGSTLAITASAPGNHLQTQLRPVGGMAFTSAHVIGQEADVCFTQIGDREPCLRIWASQPDIVVAASDRGLTVESKTSSTIRLYVTDLTSGPPSVGLQVIDPRNLVAHYKISAALLSMTDPIYLARRERLEALGFHVARMIGTYAVLFRGASPAPP